MNTPPPSARLTLALALGLLAATPALANPQIAPGLWEYRSTMKTNDPKVQQAMAEAQKAMAGMSPEQRRQMEQMMGGMRMSPSAAGGPGMTLQVCITSEQAARQELPPPDPKCSTRVTGRTATSMKFAMECPAEQMRGEGEMVFSGPKAYDGRFTMQQTRGGQTMQMDSTLSAKWLASDCGSVKPAVTR